MHRLRAVVKSFKADPVCQALLKVGVDEVYVEEVQGYGRQKGHLGLYRQPTFGIAFLPKIAITAYVTDDLVEPACKAIEEAAVTGTIGDGKIFITPIDYAIPHALETGGLARRTTTETVANRRVTRQSPRAQATKTKPKPAGKLGVPLKRKASGKASRATSGRAKRGRSQSKRK